MQLMLRARDLSGQGLVEYVLILILVAIVVIVVLITFGGQVKNRFSNVTTELGS